MVSHFYIFHIELYEIAEILVFLSEFWACKIIKFFITLSYLQVYFIIDLNFNYYLRFQLKHSSLMAIDLLKFIYYYFHFKIFIKYYPFLFDCMCLPRILHVKCKSN